MVVNPMRSFASKDLNLSEHGPLLWGIRMIYRSPRIEEWAISTREAVNQNRYLYLVFHSLKKR